MRYEVELRRPEPDDARTGAGRRAIRRVLPDGSARPLAFGRLEAAHAYARKMSPGQARVVAVGRDGWRRVVDEAGT